MTSQVFDMSVVASVVQNRLLCPFGEYRRLLSYMTGTDLPLWEISRAREECAAKLLKLFPILKQLPQLPEKTDSGNANKYIRSCVKKCSGIDTFTVAPGKVKFVERTLSKAISA